MIRPPSRSTRTDTLFPTRRSSDLLYPFRQLDQELRIALQMMDAPRVVAGEARHRLDAFPVGDRHELALVRPVLPQHMHAQGLVGERLDAVFVEIPCVVVGPGARRAAAPDARYGGAPVVAAGDHELLHRSAMAHKRFPAASFPRLGDRKHVVWGKSVAIRVDLGGPRFI